MTGFQAPLSITLYGDDDEALQTYTRTRIPVDILMQVLEFADAYGELDTEKMSIPEVKGMMDALIGLVVEIFGSQFNASELRKGCEMSVMMSVIEQTVARVRIIATANPTSPRVSPKTTRPRR